MKLDGRLSAPTFSVQTQFYFPAELGCYGAILPGGVEIEHGAIVEFFCPNGQCKMNLTAPYNHELAEIKMVDHQSHEFVVVFHKVYGRQATFVVDRDGKKLVESFGQHAANYSDTFERPLNFFGAV